jgi:hypothetical protein
LKKWVEDPFTLNEVDEISATDFSIEAKGKKDWK